MTEEEIFKNVWNETHHFKLTLANGEILDLIDLKFYTDLLGKYSEMKAENEKLKKEKQELIDYLKKEINKISKEIEHYDLWHETGTDINFLILRKQMFKEILSKIEKENR